MLFIPLTARAVRTFFDNRPYSYIGEGQVKAVGILTSWVMAARVWQGRGLAGLNEMPGVAVP